MRSIEHVQEFQVLDPDVDGSGWGLGRIDGRAGYHSVLRRASAQRSLRSFAAALIAWSALTQAVHAATTQETMCN